MTKRPRRNHTAVFSEGGTGSPQGRTDVGGIGSPFSGPPNQIAEWKKQLLDRAPEIFDGEKKSQEPDIKELHAKIGQLAMENDFLSVALGRIHGQSAKK